MAGVQETKKHRPELEQLQAAFKRIRQDRIAFFYLILLIILYLSVAFADFLAPYGENWFDRELAKAPPTPIYILDEDGALSWPYVFRYKREYDPNTFTQQYVPDLSQKYYLHFFTQGEPYRLFGIIPGNLRLFGVDAPGQISLLGNDINGRDIFSRLLYGGQISLTVGFLSLFIVFPIGMIYGGISGYFGGRIDNIMMRFAEILMSIPRLYLLISLAVILPPGLSSTARFGMVVFILAFVGWAGLARVIRGMVLSVKKQEFVEAGQAIGLNAFTIIVRHVLPQLTSYVLVAITLGVPGYILAESGLSFLGLGIQQPDASWGNMLSEAQDISNIIERPLMLAPGFVIFLAVLSFNVIGDAIRDILDPKSRSLVRR
ncbi:MAG TPA: ABC transporter permease [Oculatellaceae cyanobacterium]|jgi:peptide/nickel transport system permease protein